MRECFFSICRGDGNAAVHNVPSEPSREETSTVHTCFFSTEEDTESCAPSRREESHLSDRSKRSSKRRIKGGMPIETRPSPIFYTGNKLSRCKIELDTSTKNTSNSIESVESDCVNFTHCSTRGLKSSKSKPKKEKLEKANTLFRRTSFLFHTKTACSQEIKRSISNKKVQTTKSKSSKSTKSAHSRSHSTVAQFTLNQMDTATRGFASVLHASNACNYFRGELPEGGRVVVKDFAEDGLRKSCFFEEACILGRTRHPNLASVRGVCLEGENRMLVYEDVGVTTLSGILHTPYDYRHLGIPMDWVSRLHIALDVAKGLNHLHCGCSVPVVHGNITSSSIMMKENGKPVLSDFSIGYSYRFNNLSSSEINSDKFRQNPPSSNGYEAPELRTGGRRTVMSDIFAFGVLFLEIMCGCPPFTFNIQEGLVNGVKTAMSKGAMAEVIDPALRGEFSLRQVALCIQLALLCTEENSADRPDVSMIVDDLKRIILDTDDEDGDSDAWGCIMSEDNQFI